MDNKPLEKQAENYIKSQLLRFDFNVMEPSFDKKGSDIIIIDDITKQRSRLLKVQCKGRTVSEKFTNVSIPKAYVLEDFILFIYTIDSHKNVSCFLFLASEIKLWESNGDDYILTFNKGRIATEYFNIKLFNKDLADKIRLLLSRLDVKKYTSIIIDGIFLEKAILETKQTYQDIWPEKKLFKPELNNIIEIILNQYDRFQAEKKGINCYLLISDSIDIDDSLTIDYSNQTFNTLNENQVRIFMNRTNKVIAFEILEQIERLVNNDNLILVADDIIYESELNRYQGNGIEMILIKMNENFGSSMYVPFRWGDIMYSIGIALGLEKHEL